METTAQWKIWFYVDMSRYSQSYKKVIKYGLERDFKFKPKGTSQRAALEELGYATNFSTLKENRNISINLIYITDYPKFLKYGVNHPYYSEVKQWTRTENFNSILG
jgi:hypothetical protein